MAAQPNGKLGIVLTVLSTVVFACQDALSRHMSESYNVWLVMMLRYWGMALLVALMAARSAPGFAATLRTRRPVLQLSRGVLLSLQTIAIVSCFMWLGLINTHALFSVYPLIVAALSGPVLGEKVGWRRWLAIGVGFVGVLIILQPGADAFSPLSLLGLGCAFGFSCYALMTRIVGRSDSSLTSLLWVGLVGAVVLTPMGLMNLQPVAPVDLLLILVLACSGMFGHWLVIRALEVAEPTTVQPFSYLQLAFVAIIGVMIFGEDLRVSVVIGTAVVLSAGLFTILRTASLARAAKAAAPLQQGPK